ncbi:MAG: hypothetical protein GKR99_17240 [Rhodobacteraceae bacterium]|nr:hypothetical protein [Paracoccaceae bacterium]
MQGVKAYSHISELPEAPDVAVIAVPAPQVRENLIAAAELGCGVAIVYGAQFAEAGDDGRERQDDLLHIARSNGMRMIGPNCMGVISLASGFVASFTAAPEHHDGNGWPDVGDVSVASQSGAVGIQIFAQLRDRGLGLANWISTGNQADIDVADAIAYYAGDPATKTIAVYMEDASRGLKLVQALELALQAKKPVVVLKVGTTPSGGRAASSHTASLYTEDRLVEDLFAQYGVLRARSVNELIDLTTACNAGIVPRSPDVAVVSVSGGGAVMISDAAAEGGLNLIDYPKEALADLKATNPFVNDRNPIDISAPGASGDLGAQLAKAGVEHVAETVVSTADEAVAQLNGTIVLKLSAPSLLHKTELDGVRTGLTDEPATRAAFAHLQTQLGKHAAAHPGLCIVASPQIDGVEILVGVRHDPNFGPLVVLGSGGVDCEVFDDLTYRKAPFGAGDATAMVEALQTRRKLDGWRGAAAVDRAGLEAALVALSDRAPQMPGFEINPLIVTTDGLKAVDLVVAPPDAAP